MELKDLSKELLDLTFDQIRTLVYVRKEGSPHNAASALNRDQSSADRQLESMNRKFELLCGEPLTIQHGRGEDYTLTGTGNLIADLGERLLNDWGEDLEHRRREVAKRLVIATTTFSLPLLANAWKIVKDNIDHSVDLKVIQIRSADFLKSLHDRSVDIVVGGVIAPRGKEPKLSECDFLELNRDTICILTNKSKGQLPGKTITKKELLKHLVVLPDTGVIIDAVKHWYRDDYLTKFRIIAPIKDVHYGLALLQSGIITGLIFSTSYVAEQAEMKKIRYSGETAESVEGNLLRKIELGDGFEPLDLVVGLCARKGERQLLLEQVGETHPLVALWKVFENSEKKPNERMPYA